MEKIWKASVWRQLGAAIDMLENVLQSRWVAKARE